MPVKRDEIEDVSECDLGIDNFIAVEDRRTSTEELERIKNYSDENLRIIFLQIETTNDEEKRNIIVNLVSTVDYYIHEIVIWGLVQITMNNFPKGKCYSKVKIPINYLKEAIEQKDIFKNPVLKTEIIEDIRKNTYQNWVKIKEGLEIVLPKNTYEKIGMLTSGKDKKAKFQTSDFDEIAVKRHRIVHHFDREYVNESQRNEIEINCIKSYELINTIIESIHNVIKEYDEGQPEEN
jgi:hypothetical protein